MLLHPEQTLNSSGQQIRLMTGTFSTFCSYSQALDSYQQHEVRFNFETPRKVAKLLFRRKRYFNTSLIAPVVLHQLYYTGCTLKLRAVKLLFVIFGRLSYTFFVQIMILGNGRLSYILWKNGRFLAENDRFRTDFWPKVVQMMIIMKFSRCV